MKIAIFTDLYLEVAGGIPSSIRAQKAELERMGHEVVVFCPGFSCSESGVVLVPTSKWLKVNGAPMARWPGVILRWLRQEWAKFDFDVVHVHYEAGTSIAGVLYAREKGVPVVQTMHGREDMAIAVNVPHPFKTLVGLMLCFLHGRYLPHDVKVQTDAYLAPTVARAKMWALMVAQANAADIVLTPSEHFRKKLKHYGVKCQIVAVSNGVADKLVMRDWPIRRLARGEKLKMAWTSRVSREKRIIPFLNALMLLPEGTWEIEVFGVGNELRRVRKMIQRVGLEKQILLRGAVSHDELMRRMGEAHLAVMASYGFDTQGLTLLEAEAVGMPVFYCDPDMKEVVPKAGAICSAGPDAEVMAKALRRVIEKPKKIEEMSKVMLKRRGEVAQRVQIEKLLEVYREVIKG